MPIKITKKGRRLASLLELSNVLKVFNEMPGVSIGDLFIQHNSDTIKAETLDEILDFPEIGVSSYDLLTHPPKITYYFDIYTEDQNNQEDVNTMYAILAGFFGKHVKYINVELQKPEELEGQEKYPIRISFTEEDFRAITGSKRVPLYDNTEKPKEYLTEEQTNNAIERAREYFGTILSVWI